MEAVLSLGFAAVFPCVLLGLLIWLGRLEEDLPDAVRRTSRQPDPPPIVRIPVRPRPAGAWEPVTAEPQPVGEPVARADYPVPAVPVPPVPRQRTPLQVGGAALRRRALLRR